MIEPEFLTLAEIFEIHKEQIGLYGGDEGIRDIGLLKSALAMPRGGFGGEFLHRTLFEMASAYAFHIAENQPFLDGNKRTGLGGALVFLDMNGVGIDDPKNRLYDAMIKISARKLDKQGLAKVFSEFSG